MIYILYVIAQLDLYNISVWQCVTSVRRDIKAENATFPFVSMYSCPPLSTAVVIVYRKYTIHTQLMTSNTLPL